MERAVAMPAASRAGLCYGVHHSFEKKTLRRRGMYTLHTEMEQYIQIFVTPDNDEDYMTAAVALAVCLFVYWYVCNNVRKRP